MMESEVQHNIPFFKLISCLCSLLSLFSQRCGALLGVVCPLCLFMSFFRSVYIYVCVFLRGCLLSGCLWCYVCAQCEREMIRDVQNEGEESVYVYLDERRRAVERKEMSFFISDLYVILYSDGLNPSESRMYNIALYPRLTSKHPSKSIINFPYIIICFFERGRVVDQFVDGVRVCS